MRQFLDCSSVRFLISAAIVALLAGCATAPQIADQAVTANQGVEEGNNRNLLLNILRAYKRRPMHFTAITQVRGPLGLATPTIGFTIPFGSASTPSYTFSPSLAANTPAFDVAVLDGEEFMRGITTPTQIGTINYFLDQGWAPELIFHLFIRGIKMDPAPGPPDLGDGELLMNNPLEEKYFRAFQNEIRKLVECGLYLKSQSTSDPLDLELNIKELQNLEHLVLARKEKMTLTKVTDTIYKLDQPSTETLAFVRDDGKKCSSVLVQKGYITTERKREESIKAQATLKRTLLAAGKQPPAESAGKESPKATLYIRSPEAIIYYTGQIVRRQLDGAYDNPAERTSPKVAMRKRMDGTLREGEIFIVNRDSAGSKDAAVAVEYDGSHYSIPDSTEARTHNSTSVLTLIMQLLALQKKASEIPVTGTVRTIGR